MEQKQLTSVTDVQFASATAEVRQSVTAPARHQHPFYSGTEAKRERCAAHAPHVGTPESVGNGAALVGEDDDGATVMGTDVTTVAPLAFVVVMFANCDVTGAELAAPELGRGGADDDDLFGGGEESRGGCLG